MRRRVGRRGGFGLLCGRGIEKPAGSLEQGRIDDGLKLHAQLVELIERCIDPDACAAMASLGALDMPSGGFDHCRQFRKVRRGLRCFRRSRWGFPASILPWGTCRTEFAKRSRHAAKGCRARAEQPRLRRIRWGSLRPGFSSLVVPHSPPVILHRQTMCASRFHRKRSDSKSDAIKIQFYQHSMSPGLFRSSTSRRARASSDITEAQARFPGRTKILQCHENSAVSDRTRHRALPPARAQVVARGVVRRSGTLPAFAVSP